ncbi:MAG TPA: hypothetical protein V6C72_06865, partial [Chroococcales cyanobacterium]
PQVSNDQIKTIEQLKTLQGIRIWGTMLTPKQMLMLHENKTLGKIILSKQCQKVYDSLRLGDSRFEFTDRY